MPRPPITRQNAEVPDAEGETRADRAREEHDGAEQHDPQAPPPVGEAAGDQRADRAAEQRDRDDESGDEVVEREVALDGVDGAVDDRGVEAEEEAADRRGDGEAYRPSGIRASG